VEELMTRKIVLIGRASTGKTSIKKAILEGEDPFILMINPLEPTRGIETSVYSWLDLELSIFDTSGQELNSLLKNEEEQKKTFENADLIIYIFDFPLWTEIPEEIIEDIHKIYNLTTGKYFQADFILIMHKVDLIQVKIYSRFQKLKKQMIELINLKDQLPIYFTSISPDLISNTYTVCFEIFSKFSKESNELKNILDNELKNTSKKMCIITDIKNHIIIQSKTPDFPVKYINKLYQLLEPIDRKAEEITIIYDKVFFIDEYSSILAILISDIHFLNKNKKNLICISDFQKQSELFELRDKIKKELVKFYA